MTKETLRKTFNALSFCALTASTLSLIFDDFYPEIASENVRAIATAISAAAFTLTVPKKKQHIHAQQEIQHQTITTKQNDKFEVLTRDDLARNNPIWKRNAGLGL